MRDIRSQYSPSVDFAHLNDAQKEPMDPHELLHKTRAMNPVELVKFAREKADNMDPLETYALVLALTNKLEAMIERDAASIKLDFRKVAGELEDIELAERSVWTEHALKPKDPEIAKRAADWKAPS
jgi:hypothetical protein